MFLRHNPEYKPRKAPTDEPSEVTEQGRIRQQVFDIAREPSPGHSILLKHPSVARRAARQFVHGFKGEVMFAVKANPCPDLLAALWEGGIHAFDVASINEIVHVRRYLPLAKLRFMHPVKSPQAIQRACAEYGVDVFAVDTHAELHKVVKIASQFPDLAQRLTLFVRIAVPHHSSQIDLSAKFGAYENEAVTLLKATAQAVSNVGITFHVGSQCMNPNDYAKALEKAHAIAENAAVSVSTISLGGGFPSPYPNLSPPSIAEFFKIIHETVRSLPGFKNAKLGSEPGRRCAHGYTSVLVHVLSRRAHRLYIDDGMYGVLSDAGRMRWRFDVELLRDRTSADFEEFSFYGHSSDSDDFMPGPFLLPSDVREGDTIWIKNIGAYGLAMRTNFGGECSQASHIWDGQIRVE